VCEVGGMRSGVRNEYAGDRKDSREFMQTRFGDRRISAARSAKEGSHLVKSESERSRVQDSTICFPGVLPLLGLNHLAIITES
jgi:hypothetical protein